jgi:Ca2+-dependent lipid-binding protein
MLMLPVVRRVYVTVDVADSMQRTTIFKADRNPQWNEEFKL